MRELKIWNFSKLSCVSGSPRFSTVYSLFECLTYVDIYGTAVGLVPHRATNRSRSLIDDRSITK